MCVSQSRALSPSLSLSFAQLSGCAPNHSSRTCKQNSHGKFRSIIWWCVRPFSPQIQFGRAFFWEAETMWGAKLVLFIHIFCSVRRMAQHAYTSTLCHAWHMWTGPNCSEQSFCLRSLHHTAHITLTLLMQWNVISYTRADNRTLDTLRFSCVNILWRPYSPCVSAWAPLSRLFSDSIFIPHSHDQRTRMVWTMNVNYIVDAADVSNGVRLSELSHWILIDSEPKETSYPENRKTEAVLRVGKINQTAKFAYSHSMRAIAE